MARILLAHNLHLSLDPMLRAEGKPYPPLGPLVLASRLREAGVEVGFYDSTFSVAPADFQLALDGHRPEIVVLFPDHHAVPQKMCLTVHREAALEMIRLAVASGATVVTSGADATDHPAPYLAAGATAVVSGEADEPVFRWLTGEPLAAQAGVTTDPDAPAAPAPGLTDLSVLPLPAYDLVDLRGYAEHWRARHGYWELAISTARGCPYKCNWCAKPIWGRTYHLRPPEDVVDEVALARELGADQVWFNDDIFALKRSWLRTFAGLVEDRGARLPYRCLSRADLLLLDGYLDDLARSGCVEMWMGAESGSDKVLEAMDKETTVAQIEQACRGLEARGIRTGLFLQLGYPEEEWEDLHLTFGMVRRLSPDAIGISVSYPLPGTPFYERVRDRLVAHNWESAMDCEKLYEGGFDTQVYKTAREVLRREHSVLRGRRALRRLRTRPERAHLRRDLRSVAAATLNAPRVPWLHALLWWQAQGPGR